MKLGVKQYLYVLPAYLQPGQRLKGRKQKKEQALTTSGYFACEMYLNTILIKM